MTRKTIPLGFELGTGAPVSIPLHHLAVTGQTQLAGKTTTLEALITRSGLSAITFVTKRGEGSFTKAHQVKPYFRERADWQFVSAVLEATLRERLKFERSWIMRASKGARTLADVQDNVREAMEKAKGLAADVYFTLDQYLDIVVPQIEKLPYTDTVTLKPGVNVMDLQAYSSELQALVIRSVIEWVYREAEGVIVVIPEAWEFIPQKRGSPVLLACEELIRKGGNLGNFVWLDSQDIASVHKDVVRSVGDWILGVQREANEVKRTLSHVSGRKPKVDEIMQLERGQFFACFGKEARKVYVQPAWMDAAQAKAIATGAIALEQVKPPPAVKRATAQQEGQVDEREARALREENQSLRQQVNDLRARLQKLEEKPAAPARAADPSNPAAAATSALPANMDEIFAELQRRAEQDPVLLELLRRKPEIEVSVTRSIIEADDSTLFGRIAVLIAEGYFDEPRKGTVVTKELNRRGWRSPEPNVYRELKKIAKQGFLFDERTGYQVVAGMKVNVVEKAA